MSQYCQREQCKNSELCKKLSASVLGAELTKHRALETRFSKHQHSFIMFHAFISLCRCSPTAPVPLWKKNPKKTHTNQPTNQPQPNQNQTKQTNDPPIYFTLGIKFRLKRWSLESQGTTQQLFFLMLSAWPLLTILLFKYNWTVVLTSYDIKQQC